jgi:hypothetical protein
MSNGQKGTRGISSWQTPGVEVPPAPEPVFLSWDDYISKTLERDRMRRCHSAASKANQKRFLSRAPDIKITGRMVWGIVEVAKGRCFHCNSFATENRPSNPITGAPLPWAQVGRRIGSLDHIKWRFGGGGNDSSNLVWACLWCNTWPSERRRMATDHGGFYPEH